MNYKELFARFQYTAEGRRQMGEQEKANLQEKYRLSGAESQGISFDQFRDIRRTQMGQLYNAYVEIGHGKHNALMRPDSQMDTSEKALRRVTGVNMTYNNGFIAVDADDRSLLSAISIQSQHGYTNSVTASQVENIVDNVEAVSAIADQFNGKKIDMSTIIRETDVLKTEMAKTSSQYDSQTYSQYAQYHPQPKGLLGKIYGAISRLTDPEKYAEQQNKFEEQEVPGIE